MSWKRSDYVFVNAAARWLALDFRFRVADRRNWFSNLLTFDVSSTEPISMQINKTDFKNIIILLIFFYILIFLFIFTLCLVQGALPRPGASLGAPSS